MDLTQLVDALCRAWRPDYDIELKVKDDFSMIGMTASERRSLRLRMRRLARVAVLPLLQANRPMDRISGRFIERRQPIPFMQAAFIPPANMANGDFIERRKTIPLEQRE